MRLELIPVSVRLHCTEHTYTVQNYTVTLYTPLDGMIVRRRVTPAVCRWYPFNIHLGGERLWLCGVHTSGGQFTSSTQLINPKFCVSRLHRRSTTVSLETNPLARMWGKISCLRKQHDGRDWATNQRRSGLKSNALTSTPPYSHGAWAEVTPGCHKGKKMCQVWQISPVIHITMTTDGNYR